MPGASQPTHDQGQPTPLGAGPNAAPTAPGGAAARERLLRESHVANDAFWFYAVYERFGADVANELNARVVKQFGALEVTRLMRSLRLATVDNDVQFQRLLEQALEVFVKDLFVADITRRGNKIHLTVQRCFAFEGVRRAGLEHCYQCGPGQRLLGWLSGADAPVKVSPEVGLCQMAKTGRCEYVLDLSKLRSAEDL